MIGVNAIILSKSTSPPKKFALFFKSSSDALKFVDSRKSLRLQSTKLRIFFPLFFACNSILHLFAFIVIILVLHCITEVTSRKMSFDHAGVAAHKSEVTSWVKIKHWLLASMKPSTTHNFVTILSKTCNLLE